MRQRKERIKGRSIAGCSARFNQLLDAAGFPEGRKRASAVAKHFGLSKANVYRWLNTDKIPRNYHELRRIAEGLNADPFWWALGDPEPSEAQQAAAPEIDIRMYGRCAHALLIRLKELVDRPLELNKLALIHGYTELYKHAEANNGEIDPDRVSIAAVNVLAEHKQKQDS
ncbi:hypothetical protein ACJJIU_22260 (plasmid) [Microbulbifer sp. CnH-101-E]|uniref:hypothetical protein n=1 Tax=unclassified Microbulbifer TaxID=2619833 RepID=UPI004039A3C7